MTQRPAWRAGQLDVNHTSPTFFESTIMQDIAIYARLNAEATERAIPQEVAKGKHVVAHYEGLAFFGHKSFDSRAEADAFAAELNSKVGVTTKIYSPEAALA